MEKVLLLQQRSRRQSPNLSERLLLLAEAVQLEQVQQEQAQLELVQPPAKKFRRICWIALSPYPTAPQQR